MTSENPVTTKSDRPAKPATRLRDTEKRVVRWWCHSKGKVADFLDLASGDTRQLAILHSDKVKEWIAYLAGQGCCLPLIASKDELAMRLTEVVRDSEIFPNTKIDAAESVAKLQGYYPDKGSGNVAIQIVLTEGLGG